MRVARQRPEFEIDGIWRWADWPEREALTGLDGRDIGIDLVARRASGEWVAVQCKCYDDRHTLGKGGIDKFLGGSQQKIFRLRWIVATCRWGPNAERAIQNGDPQVAQVEFREYLDVQVEEHDAERPMQEPWPLQAESIADAGRRTCQPRPGPPYHGVRHRQDHHCPAHRRTNRRGGRADPLRGADHRAGVAGAVRMAAADRAQTVVHRSCAPTRPPAAATRTRTSRISELECPVSADSAEIAGAVERRRPGSRRVLH